MSLDYGSLGFFILSVSCGSEFGLRFVSERLYSFWSMPGDIVDVIATTLPQTNMETHVAPF